MPSEIDNRETARLTLRRPEKAELDFVIDLFSRPELVAHRPHPLPDDPEVSRERLNRDIQHWQAYGFGRWAVEHDGRLIGFGGFTHKEGFEGLNISYHLHPRMRGVAASPRRLWLKRSRSLSARSARTASSGWSALQTPRPAACWRSTVSHMSAN